MFIYECEGVCKCGSKNVAKSISDDIGGGGRKLLRVEKSCNGTWPGVLTALKRLWLEHTQCSRDCGRR